jgi:hypothetical protein
MLINKDYDHPHTVGVRFHDEDAEQDGFFVGPVARITFGKEQYQWHSAMRDGYADPDGPATRSTLPDRTDRYILPAASMTVLRGHVGVPSQSTRQKLVQEARTENPAKFARKRLRVFREGLGPPMHAPIMGPK